MSPRHWDMEDTSVLRDTVYVARQPILRPTGRVFGYELLYRGTATDTACNEPTDMASARTMTDAVLSLGLDTLTGHLPAFINLNRSLLLEGAPMLLSPSTAVIELLEDMAIDIEVIEACRTLKKMGYALALDDFISQSEAEALLPYVKYVKIDVLRTPAVTRLELAKRLRPLGVQLIAEKVETPEIAEDVRKAGYGLLQGYYFCEPKTYRGKTLPGRATTYMGLLAKLNQPDICPADLEDLIKTDVSLSHRVLRCVNSAAFAMCQEIRSIRHALVLLGLERIQRWASVWLLAGLNTGGVPETVTVALVRARCCEMLGEAMAGEETAGEFFLLGLCSLLDAMLGRSMEDALLGQPNTPRSVLDAVIAYERGFWDFATSSAESAGLSAGILPIAYADALKWAKELSAT